MLEINKIHQGRFPANIILDEEAGKMLDEQSGISKSQGGSGKASMGALGDSKYGIYNKKLGENAGGIGDKGGASRFFYCAKASKSERNKGCEELEEKNSTKQFNEGMEGQIRSDGTIIKPPIKQRNNHPTVKPIKLMIYLIKLVTPKNGIVLDPFIGSGTTGLAAKEINRNFIGIERDEGYCEIAEVRIKNIVTNKRWF